MNDHCKAIADISYTNFVASLLLLLGILISYLPQHFRIIHRRSSFGLSPYYILLGTTSGTCAFANILVLPTSRADIDCCHEVSTFACFAGLLGIAQVGVQWTCFAIILLLFLVFFPRATPATINPAKDDDDENIADHSEGNKALHTPSFRTALIVAGICLVHALTVGTISLYFVLSKPWHLQGWANFLGIFSTSLGCVQFLPQIYTTFMLQKIGSLSIPTMLIQTPGSFVWAASLAARLGPEGWSAWCLYLVTGTLQGTLLTMGITFEIRERRERKAKKQAEQEAAAATDVNEPASEETPLLRSETSM